MSDFDCVLVDSADMDSMSVEGVPDSFCRLLVVPSETPALGTQGDAALRLRKPLQEGPLLFGLSRLLGIDTPGWLSKGSGKEPSAPISSKVEVTHPILVVEDNEVNCRLTVEILQRKGYSVDTARTGLEAIDCISRSSYALVLMDCQMPELDGYDAALRIRTLEEEGLRVPIIAVTAHALGAERKRCLDSGMDDFLAKPFFPDQLIALVEKWLQTSQG